MSAKKISTYQPQPPLTAREQSWEQVRCRDRSSNVNTPDEVARTHRFGVWTPGSGGSRRCDGCDRTAKMLDGEER